MSEFAQFCAGALLCNCLPHVVAGLQGMPFPTPFAKPRGIGNSPPLLNFIWGMLNLAGGLAVLAAFPVALGLNAGCASLLLGALTLGVYLALHFGSVRGKQS